jgi:hypothetical protein
MTWYWEGNGQSVMARAIGMSSRLDNRGITPMVHQGMNRTSETVTTMNTFVVDKNKPLVIPYVKQ